MRARDQAVALICEAIELVDRARQCTTLAAADLDAGWSREVAVRLLRDAQIACRGAIAELRSLRARPETLPPPSQDD
jgi:hypothetical protein